MGSHEPADPLKKSEWLMLCEYNPQLFDVAAWHARLAARLEGKQGGPLGLRRVKELMVELTEDTALWQRWSDLLAPLAPVSPGIWEFPAGLALHLVSGRQNRLLGQVWQVRSLEAAQAHLVERGWRGTVEADCVTLAPTAIGGLALRRVE